MQIARIIPTRRYQNITCGSPWTRLATRSCGRNQPPARIAGSRPTRMFGAPRRLMYHARTIEGAKRASTSVNMMPFVTPRRKFLRAWRPPPVRGPQWFALALPILSLMKGSLVGWRIVGITGRRPLLSFGNRRLAGGFRDTPGSRLPRDVPVDVIGNVPLRISTGVRFWRHSQTRSDGVQRMAVKNRSHPKPGFSCYQEPVPFTR